MISETEESSVVALCRLMAATSILLIVLKYYLYNTAITLAQLKAYYPPQNVTQAPSDGVDVAAFYKALGAYAKDDLKWSPDHL